MQSFRHDDLDLAYLDEGAGAPVLMIHGFASNKAINWVYPGWVDTVVKSGRRAIALDNRGHGESDKPRESRFYRPSLMAEDARALLDHLGLPAADVIGYSMGARISALLALAHPDRVRSVVFGGLGMGLVEGLGSSQPIIDALEAASLDDVTDATGRSFRQFADQTRSDRVALAACMKAIRETLSPEDVARIRTPALVAVGSKDVIAGSAAGLAALLPNAEALEIPNRDHMLAVGDKAFKAGVLAFWGRQG